MPVINNYILFIFCDKKEFCFCIMKEHFLDVIKCLYTEN